MSYQSNNIPNIRTVKGSSGIPLSIDLGKQFTGTMTAQMRRTPTSEEYRTFTIRDNQFLELTKIQTSDIVEVGITYPIEGKWYFDVQLDTGTPSELKTIYRGTIFFRESITGISGTEIPQP